MSKVVVLKIDSEDITTEEAVDTIRNLADHFNLRVTIGDRRRDEDQRFDIMDLLPMHEQDLRKSLDKGRLTPLVDEDAGIIGYLLSGNEDEILGHLNGNRNREIH